MAQHTVSLLHCMYVLEPWQSTEHYDTVLLKFSCGKGEQAKLVFLIFTNQMLRVGTLPVLEAL